MRQRFYRRGNKPNENNVGTGIPCLLNSPVMLVKKKVAKFIPNLIQKYNTVKEKVICTYLKV